MSKIFPLFALFTVFWLSGCTTNYISYQQPVQQAACKENHLECQVFKFKIFVKFGYDWEQIAEVRDYQIRVQHLPDGILIIDNGYDYQDHRYSLIFYSKSGRKLPVKVKKFNAFGIFKKETVYGAR